MTFRGAVCAMTGHSANGGTVRGGNVGQRRLRRCLAQGAVVARVIEDQPCDEADQDEAARSTAGRAFDRFGSGNEERCRIPFDGDPLVLRHTDRMLRLARADPHGAIPGQLVLCPKRLLGVTSRLQLVRRAHVHEGEATCCFAQLHGRRFPGLLASQVRRRRSDHQQPKIAVGVLAQDECAGAWRAGMDLSIANPPVCIGAWRARRDRLGLLII